MRKRTASPSSSPLTTCSLQSGMLSASYGIAIGVGDSGPDRRPRSGRPEPVRGEPDRRPGPMSQAGPKTDPQTRQWLLAVLTAADFDAWRRQVRKALLDPDGKPLEPLARAVDVRSQPPSFLLLVAGKLPREMKSHRLELLRRIQRAYPADLWANQDLALQLERNGQPAEAVRYYTAAIALRPDRPGLYMGRGRALGEAGELDAALADYRQCVGLAPQLAVTHSGLGNLLREKGLHNEAIAECREAIRLKPDFPEAHHNLGVALWDKGRLDEAIAECREAVRLRPDFPEAHTHLGNTLRDKGRLDEAIAECREAIRLKPDYPEAHSNLGISLRQEGRFAEALTELRRGHELGSKNPESSARGRWREAELLVELDGKLPAILSGQVKPAHAAETLGFARLCYAKKLHGTSARFWAGAFHAQPKLADEMKLQHRYNAACAAALAGCGQGKDTDQLDDKERARLRRQAMDWLRADLEAWSRWRETESDKARTAAEVTPVLQHWLVDPDFAGVRGPAALAKLPDAERQPWQQLWADVAGTLACVQTKTTPEKKTGAK